ncbi:tyrosine-type recombinase/integrase [Paraburkholderia phosphatilytica]|uniref:tyrosine-type recombinase/integrase n=1 Tax=Paraburkholderia phosphatilytica TaxID=2282883 RepID=UPI000E4F809A|nr:tyrosine-type recombinase/integrase [Paraburkholderia phosphatilytica]
MKLTYALLLNAKPQDKPYKIRDRDSMYLRVSVSGSKVWKFDYRLDGKDCSYTLGRFPDVSIADARQLRNAAAKLVSSGVHPKAHEKRLQQQTVAHHKNTLWPVCEEWLSDNRGNWTAYYHGQATRFLARYVKDSQLGGMPIRDITVAHLYDLIQSIAKRKTLSGDERKAEGAPHIAIRLRQHLDAVFRRAIISGRVDSNPVAALKPSDVVTLPPTRHNRALEADELKHLLAAFSVTGTPPTRLAMHLLLLTSVRTVELRSATWSEFDLEAAIWVLPGERMKMARPHVVPLSTQAIEVLKKVKEIAQPKTSVDYLFPNARDKSRTMAATTINAALVRAGFNNERLFRAHGARGTFSTWAHEQGFAPLAIERQLAHVERNRTSRAYNKAEFISERQKMMQAWGDYLESLSD